MAEKLDDSTMRCWMSRWNLCSSSSRCHILRATHSSKMPCPECPHCQQLEAQKLELEKVLAAENELKFSAQVHSDNSEPVPELNAEQLAIARDVFATWRQQKFHVIEGIAGSGKSHVLRAIGALLRNANVKTECKPINSLLQQFEDRLLDVDVFLIDDANQISDVKLKELSDKCQRVQNNSEGWFGGKSVILAADFGLCLPYSEEKSNKSNQARLSLKHFTSGPHWRKHRLSTGEDEWSKWIEEVRKSPKLELPGEILVKTLDDLISRTFGDISANPPLPHPNAILLTPKGDDVKILNLEVLRRMRGREIHLEALFDGSVIRDDLNRHELTLKENCLIRLEQFVDGFPRGTRLRFKEKDGLNLTCEILEGEKAGGLLDIGRVPRNVKVHQNESQQSVLQFPITLDFAATIHSAQGKRFERVGCTKLGGCYWHGMVYTALSRTATPRGLAVLLDEKNDGGAWLQNRIDLTLI